jgi:hypothetical protein
MKLLSVYSQKPKILFKKPKIIQPSHVSGDGDTLSHRRLHRVHPEDEPAEPAQAICSHAPGKPRTAAARRTADRQLGDPATSLLSGAPVHRGPQILGAESHTAAEIVHRAGLYAVDY